MYLISAFAWQILKNACAKNCLSSYEKTTLLKFSRHIILSREGCQQGDPLGPLLFCLAIHPLIVPSNSSLKMAIMDDVTLGGPAAIVTSDVAMIKAEGASRGLFLKLCVNSCAFTWPH